MHALPSVQASNSHRLRLIPPYTVKFVIFGLTISSSWGNGHATPYRAIVRALQDAAAADVIVHASYCPEGAKIIDATRELRRPLRVFYDLDTPVTLENLSLNDVDYLHREQVAEFDLYLSFTGGRTLDVLRIEVPDYM